MKKVKFASFLMGVFISLSGCASTSITSFTDPDYRAVQFKKILVAANTNKLSDRLNMENRIAEVFASSGIVALPSYSIFPPTREFSDNQKMELMLAKKVDACLMIYFGESGITQVQIPILGSSTKGSSKTNLFGTEYKSNTTYIGGQILDKPYAEFEMKLFDINNGKMAWIANSFTGGNAYSDFNDVYISYCNKIIERLSEDNLIRISKSENISRLSEIRENIERILSARDKDPKINKTDVVILNNEEVIKGIILKARYSDFNGYAESIDIQNLDMQNQRVYIKYIKSVYQE